MHREFGNGARSYYDMVAERFAEYISGRGLVRTPVTAEQIERAARAAAESDMQHEFELDNAHYIAGNNRSAPVEPETWDALCESDRDDYRRMAKAAAEALGLSVVKGGEQRG